jgi:hypothetical protein
MPRSTNASGSAEAFLTAMPRPPASEVAETTGEAAMMSTATHGTRIPSPVLDRGACSEPLSLQQAQILGASLRLLGQRSQEAHGPGLDLPGRLTGERLCSGEQRTGKVQQPTLLPIERKGRPQRRVFAISVEPGADAQRGAE